VAHGYGWTVSDINAFAHSLHDWHNFVHPMLERMLGDSPDEDTMNVCWTVTAAALNDLVNLLPLLGVFTSRAGDGGGKPAGGLCVIAVGVPRRVG
jgi:hypothetical protein